MSQEPSEPVRSGGDDWPDDLWPEEDGLPGGRDGYTNAGAHTGGPPARWRGPALLLVVALVAAAAGAGVVLGVDGLSGRSGTPPSPVSRPSYLTPLQPGGNGLPGGSGQPGGNGALPGIGSGATAAAIQDPAQSPPAGFGP
ncbi:MAG TPA: hypothetical protein VGS19_31125 [Streptosporangiaceae bacterium]|nr:hypothetical protein [Streptosporangiaceae bacterium]